MVKSNEIFLIKVVALCFALGVVLCAPAGVAGSRDVEESIGPVADDDDDYSVFSVQLDGLVGLDLTPEPSPGYYKFLEQCAKKMNEECGREIFVGNTFYAETPLTKPCCAQLVAMGKECHDALVEQFLESTPQLKPIASMALLRSAQIWDVCDSIVDSPSPF